jgi:hypothetical protein
MGKTVDIGALQLQNENVRAVGNMKVNARGDLIDGWNRPIDHRTQQVQKQYAKQTTNVSDQPVVTSQAGTAPAAKKDTPKKSKKPPAAAPSLQAEQAPAEAAKPAGLAEAIARARQVRQDPIQSVQQMAKNNPGVTKI